MSDRRKTTARCNTEISPMVDRNFYHSTINIFVLGYIIRKLREIKGYTIREFADKVRVEDKKHPIDPSSISLIERGARIVSYKALDEIAKALDVEAAWLVTLAIPIHPIIKGKSSQNNSMISSKFESLGKDMQEFLLEQLFGVNLDDFIKEFINSRPKV